MVTIHCDEIIGKNNPEIKVGEQHGNILAAEL